MHGPIRVPCMWLPEPVRHPCGSVGQGPCYSPRFGVVGSICMAKGAFDRLNLSGAHCHCGGAYRHRNLDVKGVWHPWPEQRR